MQPPRTPDADPLDDATALWHELGMLYARAGDEARPASQRGLAVACAIGALVLLSAPVFGTAWAEPWAGALPVAAGVLTGGGTFLWRRLVFLREQEDLRRGLAALGQDAERPARDSLSAYYDPQLVLLRSEYEFLIVRGARGSARLFEESFGFTPEDPFASGPLNVLPDTQDMRALRERWESRISQRRDSGSVPPALGLGEDRAYRVFPREMTVPMELATRRAYLEISRVLLRRRYGRRVEAMPGEVRGRAERDLREHAALTRKVSRRPGP